MLRRILAPRLARPRLVSPRLESMSQRQRLAAAWTQAVADEIVHGLGAQPVFKPSEFARRNWLAAVEREP